MLSWNMSSTRQWINSCMAVIFSMFNIWSSTSCWRFQKKKILEIFYSEACGFDWVVANVLHWYFGRRLKSRWRTHSSASLEAAMKREILVLYTKRLRINRSFFWVFSFWQHRHLILWIHAFQIVPFTFCITSDDEIQ